MKPIIMSTEEVRALLDGRKTMLRKPIKPQPDKMAIYAGISCGQARFETDVNFWNMILPYKPGDVLYVREAWQEVYETEYDIYNPNEPLKITDLIVGFDNLPKKCAGLSREWSCSSMPARNKYYVYAASKPEYTDEKHELKWRPSTQMPREAARLFLRAVSVRVERLKNTPEDDVVREGFCDEYYVKTDIVCPDFDRFKAAWNARNAKRGYGWDSNPWIWAIEFEKCDPK